MLNHGLKSVPGIVIKTRTVNWCADADARKLHVNFIFRDIDNLFSNTNTVHE